MFKKILLIITSFICSFLLFNNNISYGGGSLDSSSYMIEVDSGTNGLKKGSSKETMDNFLKIMTNRLMIGVGVLTLLVMTIGGGFMIFANGQEELLNRGKGIFKAGIIALVVALSSGLIMKLIIYLLYN